MHVGGVTHTRTHARTRTCIAMCSTANECSDGHSPVAVMKTAAPKRGHEVPHEGSTNKKQKLGGDTLVMCPISQSLPVDPVLAEDGKVYERSEILRWLETKKTSPVTNLRMGTTLRPMLDLKHSIEYMVNQGVIDDELAREWTSRNRERQCKLEEQKRQRKKLEEAVANGDDEAAIIQKAVAHERGDYGYPKDVGASMRELQRGAENGLLTCMLFLGLFKLRSSSMNDVAAGMHWLTVAAMAGNASACMILGVAFANKATLPKCFTTCTFVPPALQAMATKSDSTARQWFKRALKARANVAGRRLQDHHVKAIEEWMGPGYSS